MNFDRLTTKFVTAIGRKLMHKASLEETDDYSTGDEREVSTPEEANLVSSLIDHVSDEHAPVIDFDIPVWLVASSTPGHSHLYIDKPITHEAFAEVLTALARAGLVEWGYVKAFEAKGYATVRLPGQKRKHPRPATEEKGDVTIGECISCSEPRVMAEHNHYIHPEGSVCDKCGHVEPRRMGHR